MGLVPRTAQIRLCSDEAVHESGYGYCLPPYGTSYRRAPLHYPYPTSYPDLDTALLEEGLDGSIDGRGWRHQRPPEKRNHLGRKDIASVERIGRRLER